MGCPAAFAKIPTLSQKARQGHPAILYFSFTKSRTKIAQIPTVMGNWTTAASRMGPPRGKAKVSSIMARAVSTPTANLLLAFICCPPLSSGILRGQRLYTRARGCGMAKASRALTTKGTKVHEGNESREAEGRWRRFYAGAVSRQRLAKAPPAIKAIIKWRNALRALTTKGTKVHEGNESGNWRFSPLLCGGRF